MKPNKIIRYSIVGLLIFGLILVRKYEDVIFYDPFLDYFHSIGKKSFPVFDLGKLNASLLLRYMLNTLISVFIIWFIFWNRKYVRYSIIIFIAVLIILLPLYNYLISTEFSSGEMTFFYIRRFLIQPMLLLILIPCFYYQEIQHKKTLEK